MNSTTNAATVAALQTIVAAAGNAKFRFDVIPYDMAVNLIADRLIDTDGSTDGWEITHAGMALLAAAPHAAPKFGLVTVNGETRLVPCEADGTIRLSADALRREFGIAANVPIVIG